MLGIKRLSMTIVGAAVLTLGTVATAQAASFSINPKATFLRTYADPEAVNSSAIDLRSLGISGGDSIKLERIGDFSAWGGLDPRLDYVTAMIGVFSASDVLLPSYVQNRVQDTIDAGENVFTSPTGYGNLATDILEDFWIDNITIKVPTFATYLFIGTPDHFSSDNTDPDGDFGIRISSISKPVTVPEPSSVLSLLAFGTFGISSLLKCKRQQKVLNSVGS